MPNASAAQTNITPEQTSWRDSGLRWVWVAIISLILDQVTKLLVIDQMDLYQSIEVLPFFNLTYVHNEGAAFSFLSDAGGWQRWFFTAIAIGVSGMLLYWLRKNNATQALQNLAFTLILGGALGNVIDRAAYGYVIDFIDVYVGASHWPAFNIADSAICVGAVLLIWDAWKNPTEQSK
ncbi:signal peptidase II [Echinimonas agarilytica]|uniref:Lipoprotein signal peptidase n=1 Tax=Echinimonas agarilytica TaxID=1215918 RepID=A0AA42B883_9GAMM|nr:signal peptidase II [Echinimonas agarilytica]MCM2680604.1 signal peptidase II [Echinimonas agarilytica]